MILGDKRERISFQRKPNNWTIWSLRNPCRKRKRMEKEEKIRRERFYSYFSFKEGKEREKGERERESGSLLCQSSASRFTDSKVEWKIQRRRKNGR